MTTGKKTYTINKRSDVKSANSVKNVDLASEM
jgi:hypothetical protein